MENQLRKLLEDLEEGSISESKARYALYHQILIIKEDILEENNITIDFVGRGQYLLSHEDRLIDELNFIDCHLKAFKLINESK